MIKILRMAESKPKLFSIFTYSVYVYLRTTMTEERFNGLALANINIDD